MSLTIRNTSKEDMRNLVGLDDFYLEICDKKESYNVTFVAFLELRLPDFPYIVPTGFKFPAKNARFNLELVKSAVVQFLHILSVRFGDNDFKFMYSIDTRFVIRCFLTRLWGTLRDVQRLSSIWLQVLSLIREDSLWRRKDLGKGKVEYEEYVDGAVMDPYPEGFDPFPIPSLVTCIPFNDSDSSILLKYVTLLYNSNNIKSTGGSVMFLPCFQVISVPEYVILFSSRPLVVEEVKPLFSMDEEQEFELEFLKKRSRKVYGKDL